ncbi:hypothetical protein NEISICOT_00217 [Neisseria sicca ATCC 29256]|uniref:Uncharacterized protein n=1 Tax=Neisseria sicca ATCC 29256 TaxID=547045 RepID=C6M138_NEISI|nr:hypothetical protein NEISICOT_00217 [Neisseria sicca ATCC 29256]
MSPCPDLNLIHYIKRKTAYPKGYAVYGCRDCYIWQWFVF